MLMTRYFGDVSMCTAVMSSTDVVSDVVMILIGSHILSVYATYNDLNVTLLHTVAIPVHLNRPPLHLTVPFLVPY